MRTIRITKPATSQLTKVEVFENAVKAYEVYAGEEYFVADATVIQFPNNSHLDHARLSVALLHADTVTLLSSPADNYALADAMAQANFFQTIA